MEVMDLSELSKGLKFPEYTYTLREDIIEKFIASIEESDPLYTDEDYARKRGFAHRLVPPTSISLYVTPSRVLKTLNKKPPPGSIQAGQRYEFHRPIQVGETVTVRVTVDDLYQKKGRDFVIIKGEAYNKDGELAAVSALTFIWPLKG